MVPKKAYSRSKIRVKPPPEKVMVRRDVEQNLNKLTFSEKDDMVKIDDVEKEDESNADNSFVRIRRNIKTFHGFGGPNQLSPLSVTYAVNYDTKDHKGWVKPLFSSIIYRLPVNYNLL